MHVAIELAFHGANSGNPNVARVPSEYCLRRKGDRSSSDNPMSWVMLGYPKLYGRHCVKAGALLHETLTGTESLGQRGITTSTSSVLLQKGLDHKRQ